MTAQAAHAGSALEEALLKWPGVTTSPGRFGSIVYELASREIGHVHGASHADLPLPKPIRNSLVAEGKAQPHHFLPQSGWVTVPLGMEGGVAQALEIFRINYDLIVKKKGLVWPQEQG
ncbi:MAG: luciferase family protein [Rhizobiaceae bacterium]